MVLKTMVSNKSMCWQSVIRNRVKRLKEIVREANRLDLELISSCVGSNLTVTALARQEESSSKARILLTPTLYSSHSMIADGWISPS